MTAVPFRRSRAPPEPPVRALRRTTIGPDPPCQPAMGARAIGGALVIFGRSCGQGRQPESRPTPTCCRSTFASSDSIGEILISGADHPGRPRGRRSRPGRAGQRRSARASSSSAAIAAAGVVARHRRRCLPAPSLLIADGRWRQPSPARLWAAHRRGAATSRRDQRGGHHAAPQLRRARPACCFLIYDRVEGPGGSGQPATEALPVGERAAADRHRPRAHRHRHRRRRRRASCGCVLTLHDVGLPARVVGGNPEAARRAGLRSALLLSAHAVGGALAGLGGFVQLAGVEYKLRPASSSATATSGSWPAGSPATSRSGWRLAVARCSRRSPSAATASRSTPACRRPS